MSSLLAALILLCHVTVALAGGSTEGSVRLAVIESNEHAIVLELSVQDYTSEELVHDGQLYQHVTMRGMQSTLAPGMPQVPLRGALLGIPAPTGVAVELLAADYETLTGYRLSPAPRLVPSDEMGFGTPAYREIDETFALNAKLYATDAFYPPNPVELGEVGFLRNQPVAQVRFYPVQYNPVRREVRVYRRLLAQVTWSGTVQSATVNRGTSPTYEQLLRHTLLNYDTLVRHDTGGVLPIATPVASASAATTSTGPALKISIDADGIYRLTYTDLLQSGFEPDTIDPRTLKLYNRDVQVAIFVQGEEDGIFGAADYILFFGEASHDAYTTANV